jgi:preprotein translocase subunit SecF
LRAQSWGFGLLRVLSPLVALYFAAYAVFGGERPWFFSAAALAGVAFGVYSTVVAFKRPTHAP